MFILPQIYNRAMKAQVMGIVTGERKFSFGTQSHTLLTTTVLDIKNATLFG